MISALFVQRNGVYFLAVAYAEKLEYNRTRADHKPENRAKDGGKAF